MNKKTIMLLLLVALSLLQISVPAKMAWDQKIAISSGKEYKLLCNTTYVRKSNFYGPSLSLSSLFDLEMELDESIISKDVYNKDGFATIGKDAQGFLKIMDISVDVPSHTNDFIKVKISRSSKLDDVFFKARFSEKYYDKKVITKHGNYYEKLDPDIKKSIKDKKVKIQEVAKLTIGKGETAINDISFEVVDIK